MENGKVPRKFFFEITFRNDIQQGGEESECPGKNASSGADGSRYLRN
jgi:hypothetical protein